MTKYKLSDFRPALERIDALPPERRQKIYEGAAKILEAQHVAEIRKALAQTQVGVSRKSGLKQAEVSRIENRPETVQIRTMERYVSALGGQMKIVAEFPDGTRAEVAIRHGRLVRSRVKAIERSRLPGSAVSADPAPDG